MIARGTVTLITGSRDINRNGARLARSVARYLIRNHKYIIVGDAGGVDAAIIDECNKAEYKQVTVWGAYGKIRYRALYGKNIPHMEGYLSRDKIVAKECSRAVVIWNGYSTGTKYTTNQVISLKKKVVVFVVDKDGLITVV